MEKTITLPSGLEVTYRRPGLKTRANAKRYGDREGGGDEQLSAWYAGLYLVSACSVRPRIGLEPGEGDIWVDDLDDGDFVALADAIMESAGARQVEGDVAPLSRTETSS